MKLSPAPITIKENEGFAKNDIFKRELFAKSLTNIIKNCDDELVIAIDAPWGSGKTTFVKMWRGMLKSDEYKIESIYFDAYRNDFLDDPFLALVGEIYQLLDKTNPATKKFKAQAIATLKVISKVAVNVGLRAVSAGVVDGTALEGAGVGSEAVTVADKYLESRIDSVEADKKLITDFHNTLTKAVEKMADGKKLIFIIDELDRCKPSFALDLLEKIKHIFSTPNIVFVLVMNRKQINEIIKLRYGQKAEPTLYLQKFIHLWAGLPQTLDRFSSNRKIYLNDCLWRMGFKQNESANNSAIQSFEELIEYYSLTLRDIERSLTNFSILVNLGYNHHHGYALIAPYLSIIKVLYPQIIKSLAVEKISYEELLDDTKLHDLIDRYSECWEPEGHELRWLLKYYLITDNEEFAAFIEQSKQMSIRDRRPANIVKNMCTALETFLEG